VEPGSIQGVTERLKSWCALHDHGLARIEWDSAHSRRDVVSRLKAAGLPVVEIGLPPGEASDKVVRDLIEKLRSLSGSVVSVTDIEWVFPERGSLLDTLSALSFQRETLASLPVRQLWWVPSHLTDQFILGVPDLDSWFLLRLHLTEVLPQPLDIARHGKTVSVNEARALAKRYWERASIARSKDVPEDRIWIDLAQPAVDALVSAGLQMEAEDILARASNAREQLEGKLQELRSARGPDDPEVLSLSGRLARLLKDQGDFSAARRIQEAVLESRSRAMGDEHPDTLASMNNLASTLWAQGDYAGSRRLDERALEVRTRVLGINHPDTAASMINLASILWAQGDYTAARRREEQALEANRRALGDEDPKTLLSMNNLAATLLAQGDYKGAQRLQERALDVSIRLLGEEHPDTLTSMNNLASILRAQGDYSGARRVQERVLELSTRTLGERHPKTLTSMNNLAVTVAAQGDYARAQRLHEHVLDVSVHVLGEGHPNTRTSNVNLAWMLWMRGDRAGAVRLISSYLSGLRKVLGEDHPDTVATARALQELETQQQTSTSPD